VRHFALAAALCAAAVPASAQFNGHFDVSKLEVPGLIEPKWGRRFESDQLRYLCVDAAACPLPTGIAIKGVMREETLKDAFATGVFAPAALMAQGKANAERTGSEFMVAKAIEISGVRGVHMEAAATAATKIYFITKFIGKGKTMLDIKVTSPNLTLARKLSDDAAAALVGQVFK
jgi:hypothetical protein